MMKYLKKQQIFQCTVLHHWYYSFLILTMADPRKAVKGLARELMIETRRDGQGPSESTKKQFDELIRMQDERIKRKKKQLADLLRGIQAEDNLRTKLVRLRNELHGTEWERVRGEENGEAILEKLKKLQKNDTVVFKAVAKSQHEIKREPK